MTILKNIKTAFFMLLFFMLLTGLIYPLFITVISHIFFSEKANGSLIIHHNTVVGSALIGQNFSDPGYFWGRPSATESYPYNAASSSGSNLGPTNPLLLKAIQACVSKLRSEGGGEFIPVDLVTSSASGIDPDISPAAAYYQISRIAHYRKLPIEKIRELVVSHVKPRRFDVLGEPRVNVLLLNMALDKLSGKNNER